MNPLLSERIRFGQLNKRDIVNKNKFISECEDLEFMLEESELGPADGPKARGQEAGSQLP